MVFAWEERKRARPVFSTPQPSADGRRVPVAAVAVTRGQTSARGGVDLSSLVETPVFLETKQLVTNLWPGVQMCLNDSQCVSPPKYSPDHSDVVCNPSQVGPPWTRGRGGQWTLPINPYKHPENPSFTPFLSFLDYSSTPPHKWAFGIHLAATSAQIATQKNAPPGALIGLIQPMSTRTRIP